MFHCTEQASIISPRTAALSWIYGCLQKPAAYTLIYNLDMLQWKWCSVHEPRLKAVVCPRHWVVRDWQHFKEPVKVTSASGKVTVYRNIETICQMYSIHPCSLSHSCMITRLFYIHCIHLWIYKMSSIATSSSLFLAYKDSRFSSKVAFRVFVNSDSGSLNFQPSY